MLLRDADIRSRINDGDLVIDPLDMSLLQPGSIDVRLGNGFQVFNAHTATHIDPQQPDSALTSFVEVPAGGEFLLHPGQFVLGTTMETFTIPIDLAGRLEGKSSLGRLGLVIHATAGFIDGGFHGDITLELSCVAPIPIALRPGMKIGQLCLLQMTGPAERPYGSPGLGSHYQGQRGPTPSRSGQTPATP